jgi:glycosyltransferase involved in cell wall biosynthesis
MQIALVYDAVYPFVAGGVERRNYAVAEVLRREHGVALYGFDYWSDRRDACLSGCRYVAVGPPVPLYDAAGRRRISEALVFAGRLLVALMRGQEEVWDVANFPFFSVPVAWLASRLRRRKLIVSWYEYWGDYWYRYLGWRGFLGRWIERLALRCSPRVIAISQVTRRRLIVAGYPHERITVVPGGVDLQSIARARPADETFDLIYVGRLLPHKRVHLAIEALAQLRTTHPTATLAIVGDGPERDRLRQLVAELGLESAVRFFGKLPTAEQVYSQLKSSRVLVAPSEREGFGISVIEAWGCGAPAVVCAGQENAMCELIDRPFKGRVTKPNAACIAAACRELLAEPRAAYEQELLTAAGDYDWPRIARRLETVYQSALTDSINDDKP